MATRYFCDRCEKEIFRETDLTKIAIHEPMYYDHEAEKAASSKVIKKDLCRACRQDLDGWFAEGVIIR